MAEEMKLHEFANLEKNLVLALDCAIDVARLLNKSPITTTVAVIDWPISLADLEESVGLNGMWPSVEIRRHIKSAATYSTS